MSKKIKYITPRDPAFVEMIKRSGGQGAHKNKKAYTRKLKHKGQSND